MDWQHDPALNFAYNQLKTFGNQLYDTGRANTATGMSTTGSGVGTIQQGLQDLSPVMNYFRTGMTGDTTALSKQAQPQLDAIGQQFQNVRNMISTQPRGGGTAAQEAQLPIQQIQALSNILSTARNNAVQGVAQTAGQEGQFGSEIGQLGLGQAGVGLNQTGQASGDITGAGSIAMGGRNADIQNSWKSFFKGLANNFVAGAGQAAGKAITQHFLPS